MWGPIISGTLIPTWYLVSQMRLEILSKQYRASEFKDTEFRRAKSAFAVPCATFCGCLLFFYFALTSPSGKFVCVILGSFCLVLAAFLFDWACGLSIVFAAGWVEYAEGNKK